jgi:hypothetical protein
MGSWHTSVPYRLWVIGGLVVVVGVSVALGLANPTDQSVIFAILPLLAVYMGGIFVMQARALRRAAAGEEPASGTTEPASVDGPPAGRVELARALAVKAIEPGAQRSARGCSTAAWTGPCTRSATRGPGSRSCSFPSSP